jgi:hypothetical protein
VLEVGYNLVVPRKVDRETSVITDTDVPNPGHPKELFERKLSDLVLIPATEPVAPVAPVNPCGP